MSRLSAVFRGMGRGMDWSPEDKHIVAQSLGNGHGPHWIAKHYNWSLSSVKKLVKKIKDNAGEIPEGKRKGRIPKLPDPAKLIIEAEFNNVTDMSPREDVLQF